MSGPPSMTSLPLGISYYLESEDAMAKELTKKQIDRQDAVDNAIQELLEELSGKKFPCLDWDTEVVGIIRDAVQEVICDKMKLMSPMDFYPFMEDKQPETKPKNIDFKVKTDPDVSVLYGRNGSAKLSAFYVWQGGSNMIHLDGLSSRHMVINGGFEVKAEEMDELAKKWLEARGKR